MSTDEILAELANVQRECFGRLCAYLSRAFDCFDRETCEDIAQDAFTYSIRRVRKSGFRPSTTWWYFLRWKGGKLALDRTKKQELVLFANLTLGSGSSSCDSWGPSDHRMTPGSAVAAEKGRRRDAKLLSDVLQEFCQDCERSDKNTKKEIYERYLRGQGGTDIEKAMGLGKGSSNPVTSRADDWVEKRASQRDVHSSVASAFVRREPEIRHLGAKVPDDDEGGDADYPLLPITSARTPAQCPATIRLSEEDVWSFIITHRRAMCPSIERLAKYAAAPCVDGFSDVWYHVEEAACHLCRVELAELRAEGH